MHPKLLRLEGAEKTGLLLLFSVKWTLTSTKQKKGCEIYEQKKRHTESRNNVRAGLGLLKTHWNTKEIIDLLSARPDDLSHFMGGRPQNAYAFLQKWEGRKMKKVWSKGNQRIFHNKIKVLYA